MKTLIGAAVGVALAASTAWAQENVFITDQNSNTVSVADAQTYATLPLAAGGGPNPIAVGTKPVACVYDPARKLVYVVNSTSATVSVIDPTLFRVTATIAMPDGGNLAGAVLSQDGQSLFIAGFENTPKKSGVFQLDLNNLTATGATFVGGFVVGSGASDCEVLPASAVGGSGGAPGRLYFTASSQLYEIDLLTAPLSAVLVPLPGGTNPPSAPVRLARSPDSRFILASSTSNAAAGSVWQVIRINPALSPEADFFTLANTGNAGDAIDDVLFQGGGGPPFAATIMTRDDAASYLKFITISATGPASTYSSGPTVPFQFGGEFTYDVTKQRIFVAWNGTTSFPSGYQVYDPSVSTTSFQEENSTGQAPVSFSFAPQPPRMAIDYVTEPAGTSTAAFQLEIHGHGFIQGSSVARIQDRTVGILSTATTTQVLSSTEILASFAARGTAEIFDVSVINNDGQLSVLSSFFEGLAVNPPSPPYTVNLPPLVSGYSMLSFPQYATVGDLQAALSSQLGPYNPVTFRLFLWQQTHYVELNNPLLSPGQSIMGTGFFAVTRLGETLTLSTPDVALNTTGGQRVVVISPGWNIISQPWLSGVSHTLTYTSLLVTANQDGTGAAPADTSPLVSSILFEPSSGKYITSGAMVAGKAYWILNQTSGPLYLIFVQASVNKPTVPSPSAAPSVSPPPMPGESLTDSGGGGGGCGLLGPEMLLAVLFLRGLGRRKLAA
ncbi:MAG TPA: hypothetical protein VKW04_17325 [Planctomycetota bacterium]|nr:hypothetical protein [Planctomycetota bacterium]